MGNGLAGPHPGKGLAGEFDLPPHRRPDDRLFGAVRPRRDLPVLAGPVRAERRDATLRRAVLGRERPVPAQELLVQRRRDHTVRGGDHLRCPLCHLPWQARPDPDDVERPLFVPVLGRGPP